MAGIQAKEVRELLQKGEKIQYELQNGWLTHKIKKRIVRTYMILDMKNKKEIELTEGSGIDKGEYKWHGTTTYSKH